MSKVRTEITNDIEITGLNNGQIEQIKKELTYDNPKYYQIMKYSKWGSTREPKYLFYYRERTLKDKSHALYVPIGYRLPSDLKIDDSIDDRVFVNVKFPKFNMTLRPTQQEALDAYINANCARNLNKFTVQLPTGKGKTILGLALASKLEAKTLIVVHKSDLVTGWKSDIKEAFNNEAEVGIIKAKSRKVGKHFTIATIQTLNNLSEAELDYLYNSFGLVIQDEMHHCPSTTFSLVNNFKSRYRLGLTATPERSDGLAHIMNLYFGEPCYVYKHTEDDEDILPVNVIKRSVPTYFMPIMRLTSLTPPIYSGSPKKMLKDERSYDPTAVLEDDEVRIGDVPVSQRPLIPHISADGSVVNREVTKLFVCTDILKEYNKGHSCIVFFTTVDSVTEYYNFLVNGFGVSEEDIGLYYGQNKNCDEVLKKAESKRKFITLATYSKATEGTNVKQWEVAFLVSSLNNGKNVEQAVGRIRRTLKDGEKLAVARLYDYRYNSCYSFTRHGSTRDSRYRLLKFESDVPKERKPLFSRGYRKSME